MIIVGLTGSIAMGKTETARMFASLGIPVCESDAVVHQLYEPGGAAVSAVAAAFPGALRDGGIDRALLSQQLGQGGDGLARLEAIVHPLVRAEQQRFVTRYAAAGEPLVVLDIPLLYETGRDRDVDRIVVVTAPADVQRQRALARPGMTGEKLQRILARQMPDAEKRRRADFLVDSSKGLESAFAQAKRIVETLKGQAEGARPDA